jgi:putative chitinase
MIPFKQMQASLARLGFDPGPIDGLWGSKTLRGLLMYQSRGRAPALIDAMSRPLATEMNAAFINTPARIANFLATLHVESAGFTCDEENLNYKPEQLLKVFPSRVHDLADAAALVRAGPVAIANHVYAGKIGNGNEASGDGYRYRGRTWGMLTGRDNYRTWGGKLQLDLVGDPDLAKAPENAARICARFWGDRGLNRFADAGDITGIRARWNGPAMQGLADVRLQTMKILDLMGA